MRKNTSCTSLSCSWIAPTCKKVDYAPITDIKFRSLKRSREMSDHSHNSSSSNPVSISSGEIVTTKEEVETFYQSLSKTDTKPAILSLVLDFVMDTFQESSVGDYQNL